MKKVLLILCGMIWSINAVGQASGGQIVRKKTPKAVQSPNKPATQKQYVVTNAKEFLDAIGSNREIVVKASTPIDLTDEMVKRLNNGSVIEHKLEKSVPKGLYADWGMSGPGVVLAGLKNLTIKGHHKNTKITVESFECAVIRLSKCSNIRIEQLVLGHNHGTCFGPVIQVDTCNNISVISSGLFGCGTMGLYIENSNNVVCKNSQIYSCREYIVSIYGNSKKIHFTDCKIYNIGEKEWPTLSGGFVIGNGSNDIVFSRCKISDVSGDLFPKVKSPLILEKCTITHDKDKSGDKSNVILRDCQWIVPANTKQASTDIGQNSADSIVNTVNRKHDVDSFINADYTIFDEANTFHEGYAAVMLNKKWGCIDTTGRFIITCKYDECLGFQNGLAEVKLGNKWGIVDKSGKEIIPCKYEDCFYGIYSEGLIAVKLNGKWGLVDRKGQVIVPCKYENYIHFGDFSDGLMEVELNDKSGFIDKTGREVIPCKYEDCYSFRDGLAKVYLGRRWCFIDTNGKVMIRSPKKDEDIYSYGFSEGYAGVKLNGKWGFIDKTGRVVIPCIYERCDDFKEGLARVKQDNKWGFVDKSGRLVVPCIYDFCDDFEDGLARVKQSDKWGFIDKTGKEEIPCRFELCNEFREGFANIKLNEKWGFVDKTGRITIPCKYDLAGSFYDGFARVKINEKWGFVDKTGKVIISCKYDEVGIFSDGYSRVKHNGKWGFIDKTGKFLRINGMK